MRCSTGNTNLRASEKDGAVVWAELDGSTWVLFMGFIGEEFSCSPVDCVALI